MRHAGGQVFFHKGPLPPAPEHVHVMRIAKREGGVGERYWIDSVAGLVDTLRGIGRLAGTEAIAQGRAQAIAADWAALQARYGGRRPVRVFYQLWDAPLMTLGSRHLISGAITACGGRNVFGELSTVTATVSWETAGSGDTRPTRVPDVEVPLRSEDFFAGRDPVLDAALRQSDGSALP